MKQLVQNLQTGQTTLIEVPAPIVKKGHVLIKTRKSLVSSGTEKMLVEFGKANWLGKIRQQPERVKLILKKMKADGLVPTILAVTRQLSKPVALGYCNVGVVTAIGEGVDYIQVGDRVASHGPHAELVNVNQDLVSVIPNNISDSEATFTVIGAVALNAIRLLNPKFGETVVVIGTGLIGLLTIQLLSGKGYRIIAVDIDEYKLSKAREFGIITFNASKGNVENFVQTMTEGIGADGIIITASSTSNNVISQAAKMSRGQGKIVLVGVIGLNLNRSDFYKKELSFQVACSYGQKPFVKKYRSKNIQEPPETLWKANDIFYEILDLISEGRLNVIPLISEIASLAEYEQIYGKIGSSKSIASILDFTGKINKETLIQCAEHPNQTAHCGIGIFGAGNYISSTLLPLLKNYRVKYIASESGVSGTALARKYNISFSTTDYQQVLTDESVMLVMIATRHNQHADMVIESLVAGKHVFVEKPLALSPEELDRIIKIWSDHPQGSLTVGFNRRFSSHVQKMKSLLGDAPMNVVATMNAGFISSDSWVHDPNIGGGRIMGEACHLIDLITYLTDSKIISVCMQAMGNHSDPTIDNATILLKYENGSRGVINYFSNGSKDFYKEHLEVYSQGRTLILEDFKTLKGYGFPNFSELRSERDKGHAEQFKKLIENVSAGGPALMPFKQVVDVTRATFAALESLRTFSWINI